MAENYNKVNADMDIGENRLKGKFKVEKKSLSKRIIDFLFSDRIDSIGSWLTYEVLGPAIKDTIYKSFVGAVGMAVYGQVRDNGNPLQKRYANAQRNGYVAYDQYGYQAPPGQFYAQPQTVPYYNQGGLGLSDISFNSKDDALYQIDRLKNMIMKYGKVRVKDYYSDVGYTPPPGNWAIEGAGWYNLEGAHPVPTSNGRWIIDFPPPVNIR